jgi:PPOX class probable F420-dependent enzyme
MVTLSDEQKAFLLHGTRTGKLATVRKDGRPHVAPIWFVLDGDTLIFNTGEDTAKGASIRRDPRIALCVDDETPPFSFLIVEGTAELIDDLDALKMWATRIAARYMGSELAEQYGARNGVPGELLVRVRLTKVIFAKDIAH